MKMKNIIAIVLILVSTVITAHTINYDKVILRHWIISKENKTVDGTFYMLKNNNVYIEDANNNIVHFPISSFSNGDQEFALKKNEWVKELNDQLEVNNSKSLVKESFFDRKFWIISIILGAFGFYIFFFAEKKQLKYLYPVLSVGVVLSFFSFKDKAFHAMMSTTSPTFVDSAFAPFKPNVYTHWDATYFYVESKGIPTTHGMMVGISNHGWQQQVPIPQCYTGGNPWSIPLNPVVAATPVPVDPTHFTRGAIAVAVNGIAIFNPFTNAGVDAFLDGQLDNYGGHCGRADDYHYHTAPLHLYSYTAATSPIAFALDGFAVYGAVEPDGSAMATLDANHGHYGTDGVYHYHGTAGAPYMVGNMVGQVTEDATHQIIPQAAASPIRPSRTPLAGALITSCQPNAANNGYTLVYTLSSATDSIVYNWVTPGSYEFKYYTYLPTNYADTLYPGFVQCVLPTGIEESTFENNDLLIYPNPGDGNLSLQLANGIQQKDVQAVSIYNYNGSLIYTSEHFIQNIDLKNVAKGIYFVKIQFPKYALSQKLVVQ